MSTAAKKSPRRRYAGTGVAELRGPGPRSRVSLPGPDEATLLPDPRAAYAALLARFRQVNGPHDEPQDFPTMTARDVRAYANTITFALRHDLPSLDPRDAAVVWDKWRRAVDEARSHLRRVRDESQTSETTNDVWSACIVLEHRGWDVVESLAQALVQPGEVFERYCPWRTDWATFERLHPEAV